MGYILILCHQKQYKLAILLLRYNIKKHNTTRRGFMRERPSQYLAPQDPRDTHSQYQVPAATVQHQFWLADETIAMGKCGHCEQQYPTISLADHQRVCSSRPRKCFACLQPMHSQDHYLTCEALKQNSIEKSIKNIFSFVYETWEGFSSKIGSNCGDFGNIVRQDVRNQRQQISNQLQWLLPSVFKRNLKQLKLNDDCSICFQNYKKGDNVSLFRCSHQYHSRCILTWQNMSKISCPICRGELEKTHSAIFQSKKGSTEN